jgi:hypothetical protein
MYLAGGRLTYIWLYQSALLISCRRICPEIIPFVHGNIGPQSKKSTDTGQELVTAHFKRTSENGDNYVIYFFVTGIKEIDEKILFLIKELDGKLSIPKLIGLIFDYSILLCGIAAIAFSTLFRIP